MPSADLRDLVRFDVTGYTAQPDHEVYRVWSTEHGDPILLSRCEHAPDYGVAMTDLPGLRDYHRAVAEANGAGLVEIETITVDGVRAIRTIVRARQDPTGFTYIAALSLPFRDFAYSLRVQCAEYGLTGAREMVVLGEGIVSGVIDGDDPFAGWTIDGMANRSEARAYDARFPEHPLSRARAAIERLEAALRLDDELRRAPAYAPA